MTVLCNWYIYDRLVHISSENTATFWPDNQGVALGKFLASFMRSSLPYRKSFWACTCCLFLKVLPFNPRIIISLYFQDFYYSHSSFNICQDFDAQSTCRPRTTESDLGNIQQVRKRSTDAELFLFITLEVDFYWNIVEFYNTTLYSSDMRVALMLRFNNELLNILLWVGRVQI